MRVQRTQAAAADAPGEVTGTVVDASDDAVTLEVEGDQVVVPLDDVDHGKVAAAVVTSRLLLPLSAPDGPATPAAPTTRTVT